MWKKKKKKEKRIPPESAIPGVPPDFIQGVCCPKPQKEILSGIATPRCVELNKFV